MKWFKKIKIFVTTIIIIIYCGLGLIFFSVLIAWFVTFDTVLGDVALDKIWDLIDKVEELSKEDS